MIITEPNRFVAEAHDRMPVLLAEEGKVIVPSNIYVSLVGAVVSLAATIFGALRKRLFPAGTFRIGDGVIRANKSAFFRQTITSIIFGGVILGLLVHVFGSRIYDVLFGH
jgi:hypothetical protein